MRLRAEVRSFFGALKVNYADASAYPRMSFLEHFLGFKWNPFNALARHHALGLGKLVNNYNEASELLDDLNDHWCANVHKRERNWLVRECQRLALELHVRITFLSGDVHLAAVGCLFTKQKGGQGHQLPAAEDYRYMLNVVTSAIVNTPPPRGAAMMVSLLSSHKHRTLRECLLYSHRPLLTPADKDLTDEIMLPLFTKDTDGSPMKRQVRVTGAKLTKQLLALTLPVCDGEEELRHRGLSC